MLPCVAGSRRFGDPEGTRDFAGKVGGVLLRRCWDTVGRRRLCDEVGGVWLRGTVGRVLTVVPVTGGVLLRPPTPGGVRLRAELETGGVLLRDMVAGGVKLLAFPPPQLGTFGHRSPVVSEALATADDAVGFRSSNSDFRPISSWCNLCN